MKSNLITLSRHCPADNTTNIIMIACFRGLLLGTNFFETDAYPCDFSIGAQTYLSFSRLPRVNSTHMMIRPQNNIITEFIKRHQIFEQPGLNSEKLIVQSFCSYLRLEQN